MSILKIKDLFASIKIDKNFDSKKNDDKYEKKFILNNINLSVKSGEIHALMGPNGSGKSTLASVIAGHPKYQVNKGSITLDDSNILKMDVDERAKKGIFLAMQYPVEIQGITVANFLRSAKVAISGIPPNLISWNKKVQSYMNELNIPVDFLKRYVNDNFSGGEKKRHEILQLRLLKPKFAILDETDSGLDIDALKIVSKNLNQTIEKENFGVIIITHYSRILKYIKPHFVHVLSNGKINMSGGLDLAHKLEDVGYSNI